LGPKVSRDGPQVSAVCLVKGRRSRHGAGIGQVDQPFDFNVEARAAKGLLGKEVN
jgi:hypothetical protein